MDTPNDSPGSVDPSAIGVGRALRDGFGALRADIGAHLGWNAIVLGMLGISCCGVVCVVASAMGALGASGAIEPGMTPEAMTGPIGVVAVVLYLVLLGAWIGLYALHLSVTSHLALARARGTAIVLREAIARGARRVPHVVAHLLLRVVIDGTPILLGYGVIFGAAFAVNGGGDFQHFGTAAWAVVIVGYVLLMFGTFALRLLFGLSTVSVALGADGPIEALRSGYTRIRGQRWPLLGVRLMVFALWMGTYLVCMGPIFALSAMDGPPSPAASLITLPLMLILYPAMLAILSFDAILDACMHARLTRPLDVAEVARTFE